ncbi:von Willebrand factor type A domain-containing protein [Xinfangfangia sp. CPCC 101601]|uniref:von Willebrand factor type A domain-containing protein n=1 Tax=Pseudogemmobacter lacusdianii TaxID=3069608 RepID=A0ABU0W0A9_9RHOB|nr:von Willebrand factor type A domain-containing protein [Xinfangfangia sp. CPCC 101601]MDQ2067431.1 von Willebrand factor type A domain-containing protein [Xinfangfangia sp. CPCC 101601]
MSDGFDDLQALRAALKAAPAPDAASREAALKLAMENFDRLQGSPTPLRSSEDRPPQAMGAAGFFSGVQAMLKALTTKPALAASTSVAALLIGVAVILPVTRPAPTISTAPATVQKPEANATAATADVAAKARSEAEGLDVTAPTEPLADVTAEPMADAASAEIAAEAPQMTRRSATAEIESISSSMLAPSVAIMPAPLPELAPQPLPNTEAYANAEANPVKVTAEEPVSTFSIDVDTASYAILRSSLNAGVLPAPEQVRIEEMVNYFPYAYAAPAADQAFRSTVSIQPTPWNPGTKLVSIGLQGALPAVEDRPPLNLVFLIDTSGSMEDPNKLGLLKQSLALMLPQLRAEDEISIIAYAGSAGAVLPPTKAGERDKILTALDNLAAGGGTAGAEGLELAYQTAKAMQAEGEVSRILLATDGDFNLGISDPEGLTAYVAKKREAEGVYLSVLGFGRGNLDDATMQALAQNGNGQAAYIDTLSEARKVLVDQLTGALFAIAEDVKVQVEWNPATVAEYRLIGYETRALRREDFNNDKVDAGEIGAGLQVTALYEITAPGSEALLNEPLRYGTAAPVQPSEGELGFLRLRWKAPGAADSQLIETPITGTEPASDDARFAAAIAGFGQLLQGSTYLGDWGWDEAIALALSAKGEDAFGYRVEAVNLMRLAQSLGR